MIEKIQISTVSPQTLFPELFSNIRRAINTLKQKQPLLRKNAIMQLLNIITKQRLSEDTFEEITQISLKECLKCFSDSLQVCRQNSVKIVIELIGRCKSLGAYLPYIFSVLIDRTNCYDLEGISNVPQKMRPPPGQKPKVLLKVIESCQEVRILYCNLVLRIISIAEQNEIRKHLDDIVNVIRTLIMDPSPQIQKNACNTLQILCKEYKSLLLHYTEVMGRAVLLPLIAKKSKIRIAALDALTQIFWCGLWKYNAFVFENLIGFRDPNSVPIKDFYQPSHNINYLATFIIDHNPRVRQQFMKHLYIWVCQLDDKYDHHGKLVPYLVSGLFDSDQIVQKTAIKAIEQIGKQIEVEREKDFRESKQFAIDALWTWDGQLVDLPLISPLTKRPSLGSRFFIRGHVRKMWSALYKEIKDLNTDNRTRATNLLVLNVIFTENYITQFLDKLIPELLPCLIPNDHTQKANCDKIALVFRYIGRYCELSAYLHIMKSVLLGQIVQNQQFIKSGIIALSNLVHGTLEAIPINSNLCHKKLYVIQLLKMLDECDLAGNIYTSNCRQAKQVINQLVTQLKLKASRQELNEIMSCHFLTIMKILCASYYEQYYSSYFAIKRPDKFIGIDKDTLKNGFLSFMHIIQQLYPTYSVSLDQYFTDLYRNPPSLLDTDWKLLIVIHNYLTLHHSQQPVDIYPLMQDVICQCLIYNRSVEITNFVIKYIQYLVSCHQLASNKSRIIENSQTLYECLKSLQKFKPIKKVPIYDQHLIKETQNDNLAKIQQESFINLFQSISIAIQTYYLEKIQFKTPRLANILESYLSILQKVKKDKTCVKQSIKTIWVLFQRSTQLTVQFSKQLINDRKQPVLPKVIDFLVERLQISIELEINPINMIFSAFTNILKCWPKTKQITQKLPYVYGQFPDLFDKLFKYAMNEKDIETKDKYQTLLISLSEKMPQWFEYQASMAEKSKRYEKQKLIKDIIRKSHP